MTIVEKSVPLELLGLHEGESLVGFQIVDKRIIFQVVAANPISTPSPSKASSLGDWGRKWTGSLTLAPGESADTLRTEALSRKFGV